MDHTSGSHFPPDPPEPEEKVGAVYGYGPWPMLGLRAAVGGVLMGLANLVPGISGGTMLVASGIYPRFIEAIADLSRLRFRKRSLFVLGVIGLSAALSIVLLAGTVKSAVVHQRWAMYSLFIGLTLGGVPVVWSMARPKTRGVVVGFACGLVAMIALAILQSREDTSAIAQDGVLWMFVAGVLGASAMILPGVSGGYILLLMGVYVPILGAIDDAKTAVRAGDLHAALGPGIAVVLPVGLGVLLGVLIVSNLIEKLLLRYEKPTLGALLGLHPALVELRRPGHRGGRLRGRLGLALDPADLAQVQAALVVQDQAGVEIIQCDAFDAERERLQARVDAADRERTPAQEVGRVQAVDRGEVRHPDVAVEARKQLAAAVGVELEAALGGEVAARDRDLGLLEHVGLQRQQVDAAQIEREIGLERRDRQRTRGCNLAALVQPGVELELDGVSLLRGEAVELEVDALERGHHRPRHAAIIQAH